MRVQRTYELYINAAEKIAGRLKRVQATVSTAAITRFRTEGVCLQCPPNEVEDALEVPRTCYVELCIRWVERGVLYSPLRRVVSFEARTCPHCVFEVR